jgi:hypothetical protein
VTRKTGSLHHREQEVTPPIQEVTPQETGSYSTETGSYSTDIQDVYVTGDKKLHTPPIQEVTSQETERSPETGSNYSTQSLLHQSNTATTHHMTSFHGNIQTS